MKIQNTLFKFRDWKEEYHKKAITENEIYFGSNFSLNDPFDLQLPVILSGNRPINEENLRKEFFKKTGKTLGDKELKNKIEKFQKANPSILKEYKDKIMNITKSLGDGVGVFCLSKHYKNTLLWGHYANSHKGFCIYYNRTKLIKFINSKFENKTMFKDVTYSNDIPLLNLNKIEFMSKGNNEVITEYSGLRYSTKHTDWQYENEFRIIIDGHKNKSLTIPVAIIEGIIFWNKHFTRTQTRHY